MRVPVVKDVYPMLLAVWFIGFILSLVHIGFAFAALLVIVFLLAFFRDPKRVFLGDPLKDIVSPADGVVIIAGQDPKRVSIFMNLFNVHVNYAPISGTIGTIEHKKGAFYRANLDKASEKNETNCIEIKTDYGTVLMKQIAGLIARRICCYPKQGDVVRAGDKIGLIKFGSRVDLDLPANAIILVSKGQHVVGGETVIGRLG
ncbi:MAG: phosphatidylserine decarboxylase [Chlamydiota bacterium]|nr:phosphatidylserine decarboxylase [Chlamydiota bacterium]